MSVPPEQCYTTEELSELIRGVGEADIHRLYLFARTFAVKCRCKPEDLLSEATIRALEGRRHCKKTLKIVPFLYGIMRSVSDEWLKRLEKITPKLRLKCSSDDPNVDAESVADDRPNALDMLESKERRALEDEIVAETEEMFETDEKAWLVIEADMEGGMPPDEMCKMLGIDRGELATVRKRVRRGLLQIRDRHPEAKP